MREVRRKFNRRIAIDIVQREIEQKKVERLTADFRSGANEARFTNDFEGPAHTSAKDAAKLIRKFGPIFNEEDPNEFFVDPTVFTMGAMSGKFCGGGQRTYSLGSLSNDDETLRASSLIMFPLLHYGVFCPYLKCYTN